MNVRNICWCLMCVCVCDIMKLWWWVCECVANLLTMIIINILF